MTTHGLSCDAGLTCADCGAFGAFAFEGAALCADCYQSRGSSCAGSGTETDVAGEHPRRPAGRGCVRPAFSLREMLANDASIPAQVEPDRHRLNPNCCYQACAQCSSIRRLREFRSRFPQDWTDRLSGSTRLVEVAREGN